MCTAYTYVSPEERQVPCQPSARHRRTLFATVTLDQSQRFTTCPAPAVLVPQPHNHSPAKEPVMPHLHYSIEDSVAEFVMDNPPQNRIGDQFCEELVAAIDQAHVDGARAILLRSAGKNFSYGGDITSWPDMDVSVLRGKFEGYMSAFNRLERVSVPVVSAVRGLCSGGGFELAL